MADDESELLAIVSALPCIDWQGRAWRHMFNDYPPQRINTGGARWNPPGVGAIYLTLDPATALAEGQHAIDVQPRRTHARRVLYQVELSVSQLVDLTAPGALKRVSLTASDIGNDDHTACRRVGAAVAELGRGGLLVPSARTPGTNLVVLIDPGGAEDSMVIVERAVVPVDGR
ncbi:MAG: RES family NAD+ phosphorylase [Acidimicrobiales bacterium]